VADFNNYGHAEILITSPWCMGILAITGNTMTTIAINPHGTALGTWLQERSDAIIGVGQFDQQSGWDVLIKKS
jgi:hypothetical protein